jgi:hypothetical protein
MASAQTRVERADGRSFAFTAEDAAAFVKANPGARVVPGRSGEPAPTAAEEAATVVAESAAASTLVSFPGEGAAKPRARVLSDLSLAELKALAEKHGVAVPEKPKKAISDALKAAKVKPDQE